MHLTLLVKVLMMLEKGVQHSIKGADTGMMEAFWAATKNRDGTRKQITYGSAERTEATLWLSLQIATAGARATQPVAAVLIINRSWVIMD